jgi:multicomponent Na+:H+ antiporter subunit D
MVATDSNVRIMALIGTMLHLFNHTIFKSLLFVNSASLEQRLGTTDMNRMQGIAGRMPITGITSVIASLSTAGVPPLSGFWSKLLIVLALWKAGQYGYATVAIAASVLTLAYFLGMQRRVFFGKTSDEFAHVRESGLSLRTAAVLLAIITIGVGLTFPYLMQNLVTAAK